ncbi:hypothetical protein [Mucilaginibacter dorajii]|uniref:Uncharacterized protein n=1 Tax=Mucilaginibacter dorajii TaxID=692994 RepID=A0ABP7P6P8_9SPHI|nr:hypothetical protein [Mucilaginibacter dorajii]MCS3736509.1 hypothetical protein [Mucilaginibacter dorajii]
MAEFENVQVWNDFEAIFNQQLPIAQSWSKLIDLLENIKAKSYWTQVRNIDIKTERKEIKDWFELTFSTDEITAETKCLWVGIQEYADKDDAKLYGIYLSGYDVAGPDEIDGDEPSYSPEDSMIILDNLSAIEKLINSDSDDYDFLDWLLPVAYCSLVLDDIIRQDLYKLLVLRHNDKMALAVGYDGGDYVTLSTIE